MGYYTNYDFGANSQDVIDAINEVSGYGDSGEGYYSDVKWYDHEEHLKAVSLKFPNELIRLSGEGEESGDVWRAYFKNGKSVILRAELVFPEFDSGMLS